jgi:hypothetical protein
MPRKNFPPARPGAPAGNAAGRGGLNSPASAAAPDQDRVVPFPRTVSPQVITAEIERRRAAAFRNLRAAVLSMADELRGWNADLVRSQQWRGLLTAADRMAAEVRFPFNLNEDEGREFFEALIELAAALGYFGNELGVLAARGRR